MKERVYKFLEERELPVLFLALDPKQDWEHSEAGKKFKWEYIQHQCAGHACGQEYYYGIRLRPRDNTRTVLLTEKWLDSEVGCLGTSLKDVVKYSDELKNLFSVDCDGCFKEFQEAVYPVDCTTENLKKLCYDDLPEDLDDLLVFRNSMSSLCGCIGRWRLYILGPNCD
jgi:hypothetical protein